MWCCHFVALCGEGLRMGTVRLPSFWSFVWEEAKLTRADTPKPVLTPVVDPASLPEVKEEEQSPEEALLRGLQRTATDFYAELQNSTDLGYANGNLVHGSNQKESVFMRLNNRIKALEVNMSLSGRYLEELSQR